MVLWRWRPSEFITIWTDFIRPFARHTKTNTHNDIHVYVYVCDIAKQTERRLMSLDKKEGGGGLTHAHDTCNNKNNNRDSLFT